ncbi:hypothetical protein BZL41_07805 [Pseudomonas sp. PIC25]|uniref:tetratricopeptide repeat protein n=1 Tax=Pseudomonas sp. PIC25 TaxID=1958773 RepID=UPI000BD8C58D|nr:C39 family peptidase [Pseudomonas sp. PIC25]PAU65079.1 hypothetical protein BZL41_07805 [Pseudomonas sp. PIC25]
MDIHASLRSPILDISDSTLDAIERLVDQGYLLQAHEQATGLGDYRDWRGPRAMALAARLVGNLGAPRLADALIRLGYRRYPQAAETRLRYARFLLSSRGAHRAWTFFHLLDGWLPTQPALRAEWLSLKSYLLALLRDFAGAEALHREALDCGVDDPWLWVERSYGLEQEDRYDEALEVCERALGYPLRLRSALQQVTQLQVQRGDVEAALERLRNAAGNLESGSLCAQLADLLIERGDLDEAETWLRRAEGCMPLLRKEQAHWLAARRCDIACLRQHWEEAEVQAERAGGGFYRGVLESLRRGERGIRCLLPVGFVRQHHMTCVPATLTALAGYWSRPVEHLEVAEEICYDGTPHFAERAWAERHGWLAREFTVDWDIARALIDRGVPFTLTIQYTGSGHLQAVVGYDEPRGTLLIRDPSLAQHTEFRAVELLQAQRSSGPRGMLLLPPEESERLEGLILPEAECWDGYYRLMAALEAHERESALAGLASLQALAPEHLLTLQAMRAVAAYDGDQVRLLQATEALLEQFPRDANLVLSKAASMSQLRPWAEQLAWLAEHGERRGSDPGIAVRYAQSLAEDGRASARAAALLQRVLRQTPMEAQAWNGLAGLRWADGAREEATELFRVAACLQFMREPYSLHYFRAERSLGRTERGLDFLQDRQRRLGRLAAGPTLTLCEQLEELERSEEALVLLEQALEGRPLDPDLLLYGVDLLGRHGEVQRAEALLVRAEPVSRRSAWLRARVLHSQRSAGDARKALDWCREAAELDPFNLSLHRLCIGLLVQCEGDDAAQAYLQALATRFEHHCGIAELLVERAQQRSLTEAEEALRRLLRSHPHHPWALRELSIVLSRQGRGEEAMEMAETACQIDPASSTSWSTRGFVLLQSGQVEAAHEAFRDSLRRSVDNDYAGNRLIDTSTSQEEARQNLVFLHAELVRQVTFGDGWMTYQIQGQDLLDGEIVLEALREALARRPDLWQVWVALGWQLVAMERLDEAAALLDEAVERFPLLPRIALERAELHKRLGHLAECQAVLERSFRINPLWARSVRLYVECLLEDGRQLERADQLLASVLARTPENHELRAFRAYVLGEREHYEEAMQQAECVLRHEPGHRWAWDQFKRYAGLLEQPDRPLALARELVRLRPGEAEAWLLLAGEDTDETAREEALRQALQREPRHEAGNGTLLDLLLRSGRHEELRAWLQVSHWGDRPPVGLALYGPRSLRAEGRGEEAIAELHALLERLPDSYPAWRELADQFELSEDFPGYVKAARQMVRLDPKSAVSHGYLGHALLLNRERDAAREAFLQAFRLDSDYVFAGVNAYDLLLEQGDRSAARPILDQLLAGSRAPVLALRALRLSLAMGDAALKREALERLCRDLDAEEHWDEVLTIITEPHKDADLRTVLEHALRDGCPHVAAARYWLQLEDSRWAPGSLQRAFRRMLPHDRDNRLARAMFDLLATRENSRGLLQETLTNCSAAIRDDDQVWAMASYALLGHDLFDALFHWMGDWRARPQAPSWGLSNLATGCYLRGRDNEGFAVAQAALEREPRDPIARCWLAFDAAWHERHDEMREHLELLEDERLGVFHQCTLGLIRGYAQALEAGDGMAAQWPFRETAAQARNINNPAYRRLRKRLAARLARIGSAPGWLWPLRWLRLR